MAGEGEAPAFYGYPAPKQGPETAYVKKLASNPVLRGIPLVIAGYLASSLNFVAGFLWSNAGFKELRGYTELDEIEGRYDPTVIPIANNVQREFNLESLDQLVERGAEEFPNRYYSVAQYQSAYKKGELTPTAVARALLKLIAGNPEHQVAFLTLKKTRVLAAAEASTQRWQAGRPLSVLDGIPIAVKDEVDLDGYEKSLGSSLDFTRPGGGTSWCVKKWEEAGAVIFGKTNMHEMGLDTTNNNPAKGTPLNPHNPRYYTGGSSGGSAYAVSTGLVPIALGADGGGSIRLPASFCGIYGLKPSHGRVSGSPTPSLASSCSVLGPLASSIADLEIAYRIMATPDPSHPSSVLFPPPLPPPSPLPYYHQNKILGIYTPWFDSADPPVLNACHAALAHFVSAAGYTIQPITLPHLPPSQLAHALTILAEISSGRTRHSLAGIAPATKLVLAVGAHTPAVDFLLAQKLRQLLMQHCAFLFRAHPGLLIVTPTTPMAGWPIEAGAADLVHGCSDANRSVRNEDFVFLANFTGCPALSVPVGFAEARGGRVPVGLMAMAEWGGEDALLEWGRMAEEWAWTGREGEAGGGMQRPGGWVDVLKVAAREGE